MGRGRPRKNNDAVANAILHPTKKKESTIRYPTGSDLLDIIVGGNTNVFGYPVGKIINFVGDKSSGKTFLACEVIAAAYHKFNSKIFKWKYDDCESGFSFNTKQMYGFEIMPMVVDNRYRSKTVEDAYCNVRSFFESLKDDEFGIYVLDSLDGLSSDEGAILADERYKAYKNEKKFEKGSFRAGKPKYLSQEFFPQLAEMIETKNGLLIVISQIRDNIDPMSFEKHSRAGGKAMDFYCHTVLWLAQVNKIKKKNRAIGVTVKAKTTKSKTPRPYREVFFQLIFDYGIDNIASNIDFLFDLLTPTGMPVKDAKVSWGMSSYSIEDIKNFLADIKKENFYRKNIHPKLKRSEVMEWLNSEGNELLLNKFNKRFVNEMSRSDLVLYIEANNLQKELTQKVVDKWEQIEESIKTHRPRKYS